MRKFLLSLVVFLTFFTEAADVETIRTQLIDRNIEITSSNKLIEESFVDLAKSTARLNISKEKKRKFLRELRIARKEAKAAGNYDLFQEAGDKYDNLLEQHNLNNQNKILIIPAPSVKDTVNETLKTLRSDPSWKPLPQTDKAKVLNAAAKARRIGDLSQLNDALDALEKKKDVRQSVSTLKDEAQKFIPAKSSEDYQEFYRRREATGTNDLDGATEFLHWSKAEHNKKESNERIEASIGALADNISDPSLRQKFRDKLPKEIQKEGYVGASNLIREYEKKDSVLIEIKGKFDGLEEKLKNGFTYTDSLSANAFLDLDRERDRAITNVNMKIFDEVNARYKELRRKDQNAYKELSKNIFLLNYADKEVFIRDAYDAYRDKNYDKMQNVKHHYKETKNAENLITTQMKMVNIQNPTTNTVLNEKLSKIATDGVIPDPTLNKQTTDQIKVLIEQAKTQNAVSNERHNAFENSKRHYTKLAVKDTMNSYINADVKNFTSLIRSLDNITDRDKGKFIVYLNKRKTSTQQKGDYGGFIQDIGRKYDELYSKNSMNKLTNRAFKELHNTVQKLNHLSPIERRDYLNKLNAEKNNAINTGNYEVFREVGREFDTLIYTHNMRRQAASLQKSNIVPETPKAKKEFENKITEITEKPKPLDAMKELSELQEEYTKKKVNVETMKTKDTWIRNTDLLPTENPEVVRKYNETVLEAKEKADPKILDDAIKNIEGFRRQQAVDLVSNLLTEARKHTPKDSEEHNRFNEELRKIAPTDIASATKFLTQAQEQFYIRESHRSILSGALRTYAPQNKRLKEQYAQDLHQAIKDGESSYAISKLMTKYKAQEDKLQKEKTAHDSEKNKRNQERILAVKLERAEIMKKSVKPLEIKPLGAEKEPWHRQLFNLDIFRFLKKKKIKQPEKKTQIREEVIEEKLARTIGKAEQALSNKERGKYDERRERRPALDARSIH